MREFLMIIILTSHLLYFFHDLGNLSLLFGRCDGSCVGWWRMIARMSYWQHIFNFRFMYWGWMLCFLAPFFFSAVQKNSSMWFLSCNHLSQNEVLCILIDSRSSLNYLFWLLSPPKKAYSLERKYMSLFEIILSPQKLASLSLSVS